MYIILIKIIWIEANLLSKKENTGKRKEKNNEKVE